MQKYAEPLFTKGRVLKKESLDALRDFPLGLAKLGLTGWADGILYGFDIFYERNQVTVQAGAIWYQGHVILTMEETLPFLAYEQPITICLRLYPANATDDFFERRLELRLKNGEPSMDELELGRFRLSKGARLRKDYLDLRDCRTLYNTLDITHMPYASPSGITVSPKLLNLFARMVLEKSGVQDLDSQFALMCFGPLPVTRECLLRYLCLRLGEPYRELSHNDIYERLVQISGLVSHGTGHERQGSGPSIF